MPGTVFTKKFITVENFKNKYFFPIKKIASENFSVK